MSDDDGGKHVAAADADVDPVGEDGKDTPGGTDEDVDAPPRNTAPASAASASDANGDGPSAGGDRGVRRGRPRPSRKPKEKKKMGRPKGSKTRLRWIQVPVSSVSKYQRQQQDDDEVDEGGDDDEEGEGDTDASSESSGYCSDHRPSPPPRGGDKSRKRKAKGMIRPPPKRPRDMRRRTRDTSVTDVLQPHVSVAYQAMDDTLAERRLAVEELARAERKLDEARRSVERARAKIRRVDADISLRGEDVMAAELAVPSRWNDMYRRLAAFKLEHGHCIVSRRLATNRAGGRDDPELAKWICDQRTHLKTKLDKCGKGPGGAGLAVGSGAADTTTTTTKKESESERRRRVMNRRSEYRIAALDKLGFVWNEYEALWDMMLRQLLEYKSEHGDCYVPQRYKPNPALGKWVMGQRKCYKLLREGKPTQMTEERIRRLEEVGFAWESNFPRQARNPPPSPAAPRPTEAEIWEEKFRQFADFRAEHGHGHLYQHRGISGPILQLCHWAAYQRKQYKLYGEGKPSFLTEERIERLNGVGFYWSNKGTRSDIPSLLRARAEAEKAEASAAERAENGNDAAAPGNPSSPQNSGQEGTPDAAD